MSIYPVIQYFFLKKNHLFVGVTSSSCTVSGVPVLSTYLPPHLQGTPSVGLSFQFGCHDGAPEGVSKLGDLQYFEDIQLVPQVEILSGNLRYTIPLRNIV
jgi:hypothetical protein